MGNGVLEVSGLSLLMRYSPDIRRDIGLLEGSSSVGFLLGPLLGGIIFKLLGKCKATPPTHPPTSTQPTHPPTQASVPSSSSSPPLSSSSSAASSSFPPASSRPPNSPPGKRRRRRKEEEEEEEETGVRLFHPPKCRALPLLREHRKGTQQGPGGWVGGWVGWF